MRNKRKGILMASAILGSAAIVSTGFAAWVVSTNVTQEATGNIEVDSVTDNRIKFSDPTWTGGDNIVTFGRPQSVSNDVWLTNNSQSMIEDLDVSFTFTPEWESSDGKEANSKVKLYFAIEVDGKDASDLLYSSTNAGYTTFTNKSLIVLPDLSSYTDKEYVVGQPITIDLTFKWGEAFGGKNPYTYFNSLTTDGGFLASANNPTNAEAEEAIDRLTKLHDLVGEGTSIGFTVTISNKPINA